MRSAARWSLAAAVCCAADVGASEAPVQRVSREVMVATTTSLQEAGPLDGLTPRFNQGAGYRFRLVAVESDLALRMAERGDADAWRGAVTRPSSVARVESWAA